MFTLKWNQTYRFPNLEILSIPKINVVKVFLSGAGALAWRKKNSWRIFFCGSRIYKKTKKKKTFFEKNLTKPCDNFFSKKQVDKNFFLEKIL